MEPGTILEGRYVIEDTVSEGVYRAQSLDDGHPRVVVREFQGDVERIKRRTGWTHPYLERSTDVFAHGTTVFVVSDYFEGRDLAQLIGRTDGFLPQVAVARLFRQLCEALQYCHTQEPPVVAGNLRPDSVLLSAKGEVKLVGFGLGRPSDKSAFSPIEHWQGQPLDARSDVYSLGATLYAMLTRKAPPGAVEIVTGAIPWTAPTTLNPAAVGYDALIRKMMSASPDERPQSIADVLKDFQGAQAEVPTTGMAAAWRQSRRCRCGAVASGPRDTCPKCGSRLDRRIGPQDLRPLEERVNDDRNRIPAELLPQAPEVKALVQVPQGFLDAFTSKAPTHEEVTVVDVTSQWVGFQAGNDYEIGSVLLIRLVIPIQAGADYRIVDGKITLEKAEPLPGGMKLYMGVFATMTASAGKLLDTYKEQERRHARRFDRICQIVSKDLPDRKVLTTDISATGMAFLSSRNIPPGTPLNLTVDPDDATLPNVTVSVKVVSSVLSPGDRYRIGVQFQEVPDKSATVLRRFLKMTLK